MELVEILTPDFSFEDDRGTLTQITHQPFAQTNAVFSRKGQVRGNYHYHRFSKEIFFIISGSVRVQLKYNERYEEHSFRSGDMFLINENVRHRFEYEEDTYLVVFYSSKVELDDGTKDIVSE
ncbi:MAG: cupin domain-containing protein [Ruminococcaceae bacterium]|nr:cupin domain-containing protein [Oscillospiraceae bacterium]